MKTFEEIAKEFELDKNQMQIVKNLLKLNNNKINPITLRAHLSKGYGTCRAIAIELVENKLAIATEEGNGDMRYLNSRSQGFLRN